MSVVMSMDFERTSNTGPAYLGDDVRLEPNVGKVSL